MADWGENLCLAVVIDAFPDRFEVLATTASLFTSLKWAFLISVIMTLVTLVALAVRKKICKMWSD